METRLGASGPRGEQLPARKERAGGRPDPESPGQVLSPPRQVHSPPPPPRRSPRARAWVSPLSTWGQVIYHQPQGLPFAQRNKPRLKQEAMAAELPSHSVLDTK